MDGDGSLEAIALVVSIVLFGLLAAADGLLSAGGQAGAAEQGRARRRALISNDGVRATAQLVLAVAAAAAAMSLAISQSAEWVVALLWSAGLLVGMVLLQGIAYGLGARWRGASRLALPLLWPLALLAAPLDLLRSAIASALAGDPGRRGSRGDPSNALVNGLPGLMPEGEEEEELEPHERRMISSILKLDQTTAREIMVPRMDILAADASSTPGQVADMMRESGHSRIPLYWDSLDDIVGIVHSRDMLRNFGVDGEEVQLTDIVRPALFVPDSKRVDDLLREFQEHRIQVAIVVDEYGGTAGLVTIEDLLEEIVGEIEDEFDVDEPLHEMLDERRAVMDARMPLDEVNRVLSVNLEGDGFDTLGGLLYQQLGKMPSPGDELEVDGLDIKVLSTLGRRIKKVEVALRTQERD